GRQQLARLATGDVKLIKPQLGFGGLGAEKQHGLVVRRRLRLDRPAEHEATRLGVAAQEAGVQGGALRGGVFLGPGGRGQQAGGGGEEKRGGAGPELNGRRPLPAGFRGGGLPPCQFREGGRKASPTARVQRRPANRSPASRIVTVAPQGGTGFPAHAD